MDFARLVLAPAMAAFAVDVTITPTASQPGNPGYAARGIWAVQDVDVLLEDGAKLTSKSYALGIRLAEFSVSPVQGDGVAIAGANYLIDAVRPDGQGGARLMLKALAP